MRKTTPPGIALALAGALLALTACSTTDATDAANAVEPAQQEVSAPATEAGTDPAEVVTAIDQYAEYGLTVPDGFEHLSEREETHDGKPVTVERVQAEPELRYGAEHATTVIGQDDGILYGYTRQVATSDIGNLPSEDEATQIAYDFLEAIDPEYAAGLTLQWAEQHDEIVTDTDGTEHTVAGIKVKNHHDNGLYAWVIVGEGGQIITYERDVTWNYEQARRSTAMWLHDAWITTHEGNGHELPTPAAPADAR